MNRMALAGLVAVPVLTWVFVQHSGCQEITEAEYRWIEAAVSQDHGLMARPVAVAFQDGYVSLAELESLRHRYKTEQSNALKARIRAAAMK